MLAEDLLGLLQRGADGRRDQVLAGHNVPDEFGIIRFEPEVAVGDDTHQLVAVRNDRHAGYPVLGHERVRVRHPVVGRQEKRVGNHAVFAAFHLVHVFGLCRDGHVFMDDAHAALPGDGDGQRAFGDRIHGRAHQGDIQPDVAGEPGRDVHLAGNHHAAHWF
ncbi:hypothetical protein SDC9_190040 [bioreactor metagenome]|uniref:Uncharacterized protein n=1 Tax=bioreactor metagenome TaxID=1076179 RepID=A0A645I4S5_9ZZZZ